VLSKQVTSGDMHDEYKHNKKVTFKSTSGNCPKTECLLHTITELSQWWVQQRLNNHLP